MSDEAKVRVGVEGQAQAERDLKKLKGTFESWGKEIGSILSGVTREVGSISVELARVDPSRAAQRFRDYRATVTEFSVASRRSVGDLKKSFAELSDQTLLPDEEISSFSQSLAKATYDFSDSGKALSALRGEGVATGRSLAEMEPIADTLHNSFGASFEDIPSMLGSIRGAAEELGTVGGPAALQDEIVALGSSINQISIKGKHDAQELIAVLASVGKGLRPEQQKAVQQRLVDRFLSGGEQMRLNLGIKREDFYDPNGQIKVNAKNVQKLRDFYLQRTGGNQERAQSLASFSGNLGPQLAAALFRPGLIEDMRKAENAQPSNRAKEDLDKLIQSENGKEEAKRLAREREERENLGSSTNKIQQGVAGAMPDNSIARYFTMGIGGGIAGAATQAGFAKVFGAAAETMASSMFKVADANGKAVVQLTGFGNVLRSIAGGVGGGLGLVGAGVAAAYGGAKLGVYLDKHSETAAKFYNAEMKGLVALTGENADYKKQEDFEAARNMKQLAARAAKRAQAVKDLESKGLSHGQAVYYAEHTILKPPPGAAAEHPKPPPVEVNVKITTDTASPLHVVNVQKGSAGKQ